VQRFNLNKRKRTKGGEALAIEKQWMALWAHSHCEQLVHDQLTAKAFNAFLPLMPVWSRRAGARRLIQKPMFPGYLFLRHAIDKTSYIEIMKTDGVVRILGERWDRPAIVADAEIDAIRQVLKTGLPVLPHSYLSEGHRVRITRGPLAGVEGLLVHNDPHKGLLVVSVELLQRSVAVEVDCTLVEPVGESVAMATPALSPTHTAFASLP
jgi:transcription termination/antitermination protein NusG